MKYYNRTLTVILTCKLFLSNLLFCNYSEYGSFSVDVLSGNELTEDGGGSVDYVYFSPIGFDSEVHLVLVHGFLRSQANMYELAYHYATWGIQVYTLDLLHSSISDNDPIQDAKDMVWLSQILTDNSPAIYAGQSAGGMRSVIAANIDSNAIAVLGLDLVDGEFDNQILGISNASEIDIPLWGIAAEPSACNANGNGIGVYNEASNGNLIRVTESEHCDFEDPTDFLCTIICSNNNTLFTENEIKGVIRSLSTGFFLWKTGVDFSGLDLWTPGNDYYESLINIGHISQVTTLDIDNEVIKSEEFSLYQNYPNPFNPYTNISYELSKDSFVDISIYDMRGNLVKNLLKKFQKSGKKSIVWNTLDINRNNVPTGLYIYKLKAGESIYTKKMLLLK